VIDGAIIPWNRPTGALTRRVIHAGPIRLPVRIHRVEPRVDARVTAKVMAA